MATGIILNFSPIPTYVDDSTTTTTTSRTSKDYTVSGNGFVIVMVSVETDTSVDTGTMEAKFALNGTTIMYSANRLVTAQNMTLGAAVTGGVVVSNGDVISCTFTATRSGSKNVYRHFLCFGCTVS